ncbi:MAG: V-type ATP synthase subunit I [Treponema sp.]
MAKTTKMKLLELMVLKEDVSAVIEYIGKKGSFQFQSKENQNKKTDGELAQKISNVDNQLYDELCKIYKDLGFEDKNFDLDKSSVPTDEERSQITKLISAYRDLQQKIQEENENFSKVDAAYTEAMAFSNLQVSFSELDHLSFLSLKIGKISENDFDTLKNSLEGTAVVIPLGNVKSHILVASSKKNRFALDAELKKVHFVEMSVPQDFKGVPESVLDGLKNKKFEAEKMLEELKTEKENFAQTHKEKLIRLISSLAIAVQIENVKQNLESTELVYRITGWIPEKECESYMKDLDNLTESRIAIRAYEPFEVPAILSGKEEVPVKLSHGKFVHSFERMIFSYGSPVYGTIDPTPWVAIFFTLLFGIMFGDCGQGLVLFLMGILMSKKVLNMGKWNQFSPIFMAVGISSSIMGILTGEFFGTEELLEPFAHWVTGLFGNPHAPIIKLMPSSDPKSIYVMFGVFGVAVAIGFIINTCGLIINIVNNFIRKRYGEALFGKNGLAGAVFFWYVIALVLRIVLLHHSPQIYDWVIIGVSLFFAAFASPFERLFAGEKPLLENGFGTYLISSIVEVIEVISGYLSNTVSFVRVGAFALSHAVLNFTIMTLTSLCGGKGTVGGIIVLIVGNALIVVLEGMIVAIQVVRLQYYEFFSKFFHETGKEFNPFKFEIVT